MLKMQTSSGAVLVGRPQERRDVVFLARVERAGDDASARGFDVGDQRRELLAVPASGEHGETFGGEFPRDRAADEVAGADHRSGGIPAFQLSPPQ